MVLPEENPIYGPFFGVMGAAAAIIFSGKRFEIKFFIHCQDFPIFVIFRVHMISCLIKCFCGMFLALGAAYGTAKSGTGIAAMSVMRPELIMKSIIPVVMAGIIAIYGLVVAVLIAGALEEPSKYPLYK